MYGVSTTSTTSAAGAATLAHTGADTFWLFVTGIAAIMIGLMIMRLRPKQEF